ncbi:MAG: tetratricopeptide repeat protein [Treponema sp.]|jgi:putative GTP pyrophosphokinase|nr:tetratricopeptide repeat protein [Treponema sp.]
MKDIITPNKGALRQAFESVSKVRSLIVEDIESRVKQALSSLSSPPTLKIRLKEFNSYYKKYLRLLKSDVAEPYITDLMGIRVICPFIEDITRAETLIKEHFEVIETEQKGHYTFKEFGYESIHLLIKIPADIARERGQTGCDVVEVQIRTILQDAWAEVEHELVYKAEFSPFDMPMKRKLAAVNASLSLADIIFQEIRGYQKQLNSQLEKRRETFYQKIEESTDALLFSDIARQKIEQTKETSLHKGSGSIDDLLLDALYAHNKNQFEEAIALYSQILELKPEKSAVCSLIYKHRGMANFAQSKYQDAIDDFTHALDLDRSYKTAYYRGVVRSVLKEHSEAIDDFTLSLELNPFQAFCLFRRGQAYYHAGDYPQALSDCEASLAMEPQNETVQKFRALLQSKLKM